MITYELAKQLKDAGFSQDWSEWEEHDQELLKADWDMYGKGYAPDLLELIEACGDRFSYLSLNEDPDRWTATANNRWSTTEEAGTPEEAVAELWLKLNKK